MGYAPVARITEPPDPADSGTTLSVFDGLGGGSEGATGDRFPLAPFTGLVWPSQQIPRLGINAEQPTVVSIDGDDLVLIRGTPGIAIQAGMQIAALHTVPLYNVDEDVVLTESIVDADVVIFQVRSPDGFLDEIQSYHEGPDYEGTVSLDAEGLWHWRTLADSDEPGPEHTLFVRFSEVV